MTAFLMEHWAASDKQIAPPLTEAPAELARWQERQARAREERLYTLVSRAVFAGTIKAHVVLAIAAAVVFWIASNLANR